MPHLTDAALAALLDPNGGGAAGNAARVHVAECAACAALVERVRADEAQIAGWLEALDHPVPSVDPRALLRRRRHTAARRVAWWGVAATLAGVTAAAAAVAPHSPVRRLVQRLVHPAHASPPVETRSVAVPASSLSGVEIVPSGPVEIQFASAQSAGVVRIARGNGPALRVEAAGEHGTYVVGHDRVTVTNHATDSASYRVTLPPGEHVVRITVREHTIYDGAGPAAEVAIPLR